MENQLKPYDKYILYVFILDAVLGFLSWWVPAFDVAGLLCLAFYIVAVITDANQITAAGKVAPSKWWVLILPVYLWKRANVLSTSKQAFWGVIIAFVASCVINFAMGVAVGAAMVAEASNY